MVNSPSELLINTGGVCHLDGPVLKGLLAAFSYSESTFWIAFFFLFPVFSLKQTLEPHKANTLSYNSVQFPEPPSKNFWIILMKGLECPLCFIDRNLQNSEGF